MPITLPETNIVTENGWLEDDISFMECITILLYMGVSKNNGTPKWMVKIMENPMNKWMIWGVFPLYLETPIYTCSKKAH